MNVLAFDIEADGLLLDATQIHCGVTYDFTTQQYETFTDPTDLYLRLCQADRLVAHNGRMYDCPVLERLAGRPADLPPLPPCLDTILLSRLLWPDKGNTPAGGHSLEQWGEHLGFQKKHTDITDWSVFTPEMLERCESDVQIQVALYKYLLPRLVGWEEAVKLEHQVASIITKQIQNGFCVDVPALDRLEQDLAEKRLGLLDSLSHIPPWVEEVELKTPQYWLDPETQKQYTLKSEVKGKGSTEVKSRLVRGPNKIKRIETMFNSGSDDHIRRYLKETYGWVGDLKTDGGKDSVKSEVLETLDYPEAQVLSTISQLDKIAGYVPNWRESLRDGRIHGNVITNGTVAGRMSHSNPNMGQVPSTDKPFGHECRSLFKARDDWSLVGIDAKALEARMLGAAVSRWDGGEFGRLLEATDIHDLNMRLAGLASRAESKRFYFKFVFGGKTDPAVEEKLYAACPALRTLKDSCILQAKTEGYVVLADGRKVPVRKRPLYGRERTQKEKDTRRYGVAVNNLLQGNGAVVMKKALCIFYEAAERVYGPHGTRWALCANVHDEQQMECEPEIAEDLGKLFVQSITKAGEYFKLGVRLDGEYKVGRNWAETH